MKLRILYLIDNLQRGGAEVSLMEILSRITRFEVVVYTLYDRNNGLKEEFQRRGIRVECLGLAPGYLNLFRTNRFIKHLKSESAALIHATLYKSDIFSRIISGRLKVPLINSFVNNSYDPRRYASESWKDRVKVRILQWIDRLTASRVDGFLSNSNAILDSNCRALGVDVGKAITIPRGRVVPDWSEPDQNLRKSRQYQFFGRNGKCFMNTGRLIERKGQGDLITAFADVSTRYPDAFLVIVGDGPFRTTLEMKCFDLGLSEKILFMGTRSDVPDLLRAADYFVFPSWYEGLPGAVVEAMLAGVPVIVSDIPENVECAGDTALLHKVRNPEALTHAMLTAIDFQYWPATTRKAYDRARHLFDIESVVNQYELFYAEKIRNWSGRVPIESGN